MSIRVVSFILMFLMLHPRDSVAQTKAPGQALIPEKNELPSAERRGTLMNVAEKIYGGVPAAVEVGKKHGSGRKMMNKRDMGMVKEEEGLQGDELKIKVTAANSVGVHNVNCKLLVRAVPRSMDDVKMAGFVAFNADYHVPKPHPPKNN